MFGKSSLPSSPGEDPILTIDFQRKIDLGPRWSIQELEIFLKHYKTNSLAQIDLLLKDLKDAGYMRTVRNVQSVFDINKNFLKNNCTAGDLYAVLEDRFEEMKTYQKIMETKNILHNNKKKVNYTTVLSPPPPLRPTFPPPHHSLPSVTFSFLSLPIITHLYNFFTQPKTTLFEPEPPKKATSEFSLSSKRIFLEPIGKRARRKSSVPRLKAIRTSDLTSLGQVLKLMEGQARFCTGKTQIKRGEEYFPQMTARFIEHEYFYSYIDSLYFSHNEFKEMLLAGSFPLTYSKTDSAVLRLALPKPRRFSKSFIRMESERLENFRLLLSNFLHENLKLQDLELRLRNQPLLEKVRRMNPLTVGQVVMAIHPVCKHFHSGAVLTANIEHNIIKFFTNELGVQKIKDCRICVDAGLGRENEQDDASQGNSNAENFRENNENNTNASANEEGIVQDIDYFAMGFLLKMLDRKTALITELRNYNNRAESTTNPKEIDEKFLQEYGWIGVQINIVDSILKHISAKFRLRGLNNYSKEDLRQISENFDKILTNPLKGFLEKESESILDDATQETVGKLKSVVNYIAEEKIESKVVDLIESYEKSKETEDKEGTIKTENSFKKLDGSNTIEIEDDLNEEKQKELKGIVQNCLGVLMSLKQNSDIKLTENKFIKNINESFSTPISEQYHQINNYLLNLSLKYKS